MTHQIVDRTTVSIGFLDIMNINKPAILSNAFLRRWSLTIGR